MSDVEVTRETHYTGDLILSNAEKNLLDRAHDSMSSDDVGFTGGVSAGYNWQYDQIVFGFETDISAMNVQGGMTRNVTKAFDGIFTDPDLKVIDKVDYNVDAFGTLRGRLGFVIDNVMLYGTGGLAYGYVDADSEVHAQDTTGSESWRGSDSGWNIGWTVGGGIEYGIGRWSLGAEYLYVDLASTDWRSPSRIDLAADWDMDTSFSVLRATGKVRF